MDIDLEEGKKIKTAIDIAVFNQKGQVLLGKRLAKSGFATWGFPGGHLKTNEKIKDCARRELEEELGKEIEIKITDQILAVRENNIPPYFIHHITIILKGEHLKGKALVNEPDRCESWQWFDLDNLPIPLFSGMEKTLRNYKSNKILVVSDWNK